MPTPTWTLGTYLAARLEQIGLRHYFGVPGDFNLVLLDEILKNKNLQFIGCCNELNAGYAADGYARATGASAVFVTFGVGGLSLVNAIAGAYAEDLPVILISGGPNTNSEPENQVLHHTPGLVHYSYQRDIFAQITAEAFIIRHVSEAASQIDHAIEKSLRVRKPVYLEIPCNLPSMEVGAPTLRDFKSSIVSDPKALAAAVEHAARVLNEAKKPILISGVKLRPAGAVDAFQKLIETAGYAFATMPNAKGLLPENHPSFIGTYWGPVSTAGTAEIVESADAYLFAGATFTDYTTSGYSALINSKKLIRADIDQVRLQDRTYTAVALPDFLLALAKKLKQNNGSLAAYQRIQQAAPAASKPLQADAPLSTRRLFERIQKMLDAKSTVIAETGDSWFNGLGLSLPPGAGFEIQMQYGSIGWSVGATLGYSVSTQGKRRVISLIGDGSFQLTAQEVSTMIRYNVNPIVFLLNNRGYTIEVEIHDGPYNNIKNWDYAGLMDVFNAGEGKGLGLRAKTEGELEKAIATAQRHDGPCLIEIALDRDDCSRNLLEWGSRVATNNSRTPRIS